jgi:hypothetical protein
MTRRLAASAEICFALRVPKQVTAKQTSTDKLIAVYGCACGHARGADAKRRVRWFNSVVPASGRSSTTILAW